MTDHKLLPRVPTEEAVNDGVQFALRAKVTDSWTAYISDLYQVMFDASLACEPAAELPGWEEMVNTLAEFFYVCAVAHHSRFTPGPLDSERFRELSVQQAGEVLTAARVPELLARVQRLEGALNAVLSDSEMHSLSIRTRDKIHQARAALESKP